MTVWQAQSNLNGAGGLSARPRMTGAGDRKTSDEASAYALSGSEFIRGVQNAGDVRITADQIAALSVGPTYYVSTLGNDINSGTLPTDAWRTIARVNAGTYKPGDKILLRAQDTFTETLAITTTNFPNAQVELTRRLTIGSYGQNAATGGRATISAVGLDAITVTNVGNVIVKDLVAIGNDSAGHNGLYFLNSVAGNLKLPNIAASNMEISHFGDNGVRVRGTADTSGFENVLLEGIITHHCATSTTVGTSGIRVNSSTAYGNAIRAHRNVTIRNCLAYEHIGNTGGDTTGNGILVEETDGVLIEWCEAYRCAYAGNGGVGIWFGDVDNGIIQRCESHHNDSLGTDGGGFDIDGGCHNCTMQYNYAHDNRGPGFLVYTYDDGTISASDNLTVRYNLSIRDGNPGLGSYAGIYIGSDKANSNTNLKIYNNTVIAFGGNTNAIGVFGGQVNSQTGHVMNNIFFQDGNNTPLNCTGNPTGLLFQGNLYATPDISGGLVQFGWDGTTFGSRASWQASYTTQEKVAAANVAITSDPKFLISPEATVSPQLSPTTHGYKPELLGHYCVQRDSPALAVGLNLLSMYSIDVGKQDFYGNAIPDVNGLYNVGAFGGKNVTWAPPSFKPYFRKYLFSDLPDAMLGDMHYITDSNTTTFGAVIGGGGGSTVLAHFNGTNWTVMAK